MDDKLIDKIESLTDNVDALIEAMYETASKPKEEADLSSIDSLNDNVKSYETYFKNIEANTTNINSVLSSILSNFELLQQDEETEVQNPAQTLPAPPPQINLDIEQSMFDEYKQDLSILIGKISDLNLTLSDLGVNIDLKIDAQSTDAINEQLDELTAKLDNFKILSNNITFSQLTTGIDEIKETLTSIQKINFDNISLKNLNLDVLDVNKIDEFIAKIQTLKDLDISIDINTNFEQLETTLTDLKKISDGIDFTNIESVSAALESLQETNSELDFSNLESLKNIDVVNIDKLKQDLTDLSSIDITNVITQLNSLDFTGMDIDINTVKAEEKIDSLKNNITQIQEGFSNLELNADLKITTNIDSIKNDIQQNLSQIDLTIKPKIDIKEQLEKIQAEPISIDLTPNIKIDDQIFAKGPAVLPQIETNTVAQATANQDMVLKYMKNNQETLQNLASILETYTKSTNVTPIQPIVQEVKEEKSIANVSTADKKVDPNTSIQASILSGIQKMVQQNDQIYKALMMKALKDNSSDY